MWKNYILTSVVYSFNTNIFCIEGSLAQGVLDRFVPVRWKTLRLLSSQEHKAIAIASMRIEEASVKIRAGYCLGDDAAESLQDLAGLPGNRLESLSGDRAGQHGIRINQQWRICFRREDHGPYDVEIVNYH